MTVRDLLVKLTAQHLAHCDCEIEVAVPLPDGSGSMTFGSIDALIPDQDEQGHLVLLLLSQLPLASVPQEEPHV